jgi:hypothetical protein
MNPESKSEETTDNDSPNPHEKDGAEAPPVFPRLRYGPT